MESLVVLELASVGDRDIPVPADTGDASSPGSGLFSSIEDDVSPFAWPWLRRLLCQRRQKTKPTRVKIPSAPPTAPATTVLEGLELPPEEFESVGSELDVDRGAVDEMRMFRSLKYSNWSGRSQ